MTTRLKVGEGVMECWCLIVIVILILIEKRREWTLAKARWHKVGKGMKEWGSNGMACRTTRDVTRRRIGIDPSFFGPY